MRLRSLLFASPLLALFLCCGGSKNNDTPAAPNGDDAGADTGPTDDGGTKDSGPPLTGGKVDLLFVVDTSASMADKQAVLGASIDGAIRRLAGADLHIGVVTSALGSGGGDICPDQPRFDDHARLAGGNVLAFTPGGDVDELVKDAQQLVTGVGATGCGFEATLEAAYRFLAMPDPPSSIVLDSSQKATYGTVDATLLAQRAAFLRPDSVVAIVMLTDDDDRSIDGLSVGGQGWAFGAYQFPGSNTFRADAHSTTAPRGTSICATKPSDPACTSCGFAATCNAADPACQAIKNDPSCQMNGGYFGATEDDLNVRFANMKQRFGLDPQYPIDRYVAGFTNAKIPNGAAEHDSGGKYVGTASCTNPLFASALPKAPGDETCDLPAGTRTADSVLLLLLGGVPGSLLAPAPDWSKILGSDPATYDKTGIDPHMVVSITPRATLPAPSATKGDNGSDPIEGREWDTLGDDLQFACTFDYAAPKTCAPADPSCVCGGATNPPVCNASSQQVKGFAHPTVRELRVAKALGARAQVASLCTSGATAYAAPLNAFVDQIATKVK